MKKEITGAWQLETWIRYQADGEIVYPLGKTPRGVLIYDPDGSMAVQMVVADRSQLDTDDPVGGSEKQRAEAYSTCLAYFGTYEVENDQIVHNVDAALFPNWSNTRQERPFIYADGKLILQVNNEAGVVTNEIIWKRKRA